MIALDLFKQENIYPKYGIIYHKQIIKYKNHGRI